MCCVFVCVCVGLFDPTTTKKTKMKDEPVERNLISHDTPLAEYNHRIKSVIFHKSNTFRIRFSDTVKWRSGLKTGTHCLQSVFPPLDDAKSYRTVAIGTSVKDIIYLK